jgi:hypothetical protein
LVWAAAVGLALVLLPKDLKRLSLAIGGFATVVVMLALARKERPADAVPAMQALAAGMIFFGVIGAIGYFVL